ncbi:hypothetical protein H072_4258 [Dactylellina haptotyla CBS 200.50]|uniref:Enoyl reductase (ER) domain-containing protein n=1 Tax=Dactylellina haptotyla (strain CBS 200.50) TaxID=1284197 RepID=S8C2D9_DACHA|nr:hypothetical protein H072_4258 [Dactylellina haptotyla CBS 200.50]
MTTTIGEPSPDLRKDQRYAFAGPRKINQYNRQFYGITSSSLRLFTIRAVPLIYLGQSLSLPSFLTTFLISRTFTKFAKVHQNNPDQHIKIKMVTEGKTNKAAVYANPGTTEIKILELEIPQPGTGQVLVRFDLAVCKNSWSYLPYPTPPNQVGGHEGIGEVISIGSAVDDGMIGKRVGIKWLNSACTECEFCLSALDASCPKVTVSGYYTPGTFQQYCLAAANYVTPIPESLSSEGAAPLLCGGMTVWSALKKADLKPDQWVVIPGAGGGLGHLAIQFVKNSYKGRVIAVDAGAKESFCKKLGADAFLDFRNYNDEELAKAVKELTGGAGAHVVLVTTGSQKSYDQSIGLLRPGGKMICVGIPDGEENPIKGLVASHIATQQKQVIGSAIGSLQDTEECLAAAEKGEVKVEIRVEKLEKLGEIFKDMEECRLTGRVVLDLS